MPPGRTPNAGPEWDHIFVALNQKIALACSETNWDPHDRIEWATWTKQKGLIACTSDSMVSLVIKMVGDIIINGQTFRAWCSGEQEYEEFLTCNLPKEVKDFFNNKEIMMIFMKQNGLNGIGEHGTPEFDFTDINGVTKLTMGVSSELGDKLRSLGGFLGIGAFSIKAHIEKTNKTI